MPDPSFLAAFTGITDATQQAVQLSAAGWGLTGALTTTMYAKAGISMFRQTYADLAEIRTLNPIEDMASVRERAGTELLTGPPGIVRILGLTLGLIEFVQLLNGFGPPDTGGDFRDGDTTFSHSVYDLLVRAAPADWISDGANEYQSRNDNLLIQVTSIAQADRAVANIVASQAGVVEDARIELAGIVAGLSGALTYAIYLLLQWYAYIRAGCLPAAEATARFLEKFGLVAASTAAAGTCVALGVVMGHASIHSEPKLNDQTANYQSVINELGTNTSIDAPLGPLGPAPAAQGRAAAVFSEFTQSLSRPSNESDPADLPSDSRDHRTGLNTLIESMFAESPAPLSAPTTPTLARPRAETRPVSQPTPTLTHAAKPAAPDQDANDDKAGPAEDVADLPAPGDRHGKPAPPPPRQESANSLSAQP